MRNLATPAAASFSLEPSILPAIDALVARYSGRDVVAGSEVVDLLLDLRLLIEAEQLVLAESGVAH
jgi:hypothetical protein